MSATSSLRGSVLDAKQRLIDGRLRLRELHESGMPGRRIVSGLSDLMDSILSFLYHEAVSAELGVAQPGESPVALVLHGGCGRRDVAPYSDVDLMLLHRGDLLRRVESLAKRLSQDIVDVGYQLGFSVRTPRQACGMAMKDPSIFSSLTESRFLAGNVELYSHFLSRLKRLAQRRSSALLRGILAAREAERVQFGETVYLLRPHLKKSRGGLRDIHLVRWVGFVRNGETDIDQLCRKGALPPSDAGKLNGACEFLLRLRNEMHFHAGRLNDRLGREEQVRLAKVFEYPESEGVLPVEAIMRDYFQHTSEVRYACDHFVESVQSRRLIANVLAPLMTRQIDENFRMGPFSVGAHPAALPAVKDNLEHVLRLMHLSIVYSKDIEHDTWESIRQSMIDAPRLNLTPECARQFVALMSSTGRLGYSLRKLHEMRVLEKIIPAFSHARSLLQFNEYHKYTVDEHSIRAVERGTAFQRDNGQLGKVYRSLRDKHVLHLALLVHDLGKGYGEDHCEVGRRIAADVTARLELDSEDAEDVKFLVHNHLMMSHVAFRRDLNDEAMVAEFAANVGSVKLLKLLYLLTCADIAAVGPDVLNEWKLGLLTELYVKSKNVLTGYQGGEGVDLSLEQDFQQIADLGADPESRAWLIQQARSLPATYCRQHTPETIAEQLLMLRETIGNQIQCWIHFIADKQMIELCIGKREHRLSGIFYKITGMLAERGLRIQSADIKHLGNSLVWYWFQFEDMDFKTPPESRLSEIRRAAAERIGAQEERPPSFRQHWKKSDTSVLQNTRTPIRVQIDNQTVQTATVIDVFAFYKLGLLYTISKKIFELGLDVRFARITTYGEQVVNVFYVTDGAGHKVRDLRRLADIRRQLTKSTKQFLGVDQKKPAG